MSKLAINGGRKLRYKPFPMQETIGEEEKQEILKVLDKKVLSAYRGNAGDNFWGGEMVNELERKFSKYFNVEYSLAVNSCTSALQIACGAIGLQPGDEVIVTPWSMSCSATAPMVWGAVPIFADIENEFFCLDPESIESKITKRTKAIIVVDLFGQPYDHIRINKIAKKYNLYVIEDAAQAIGSTDDKSKFAGTFGDIGCFSFTQGKHLTAGEGGMIVTNNEELMSKCALLRNHAEAVANNIDDDKYINNHMFGFNMRMTEIQAAILIHQLDKLHNFINKRIKLAESLQKDITKIPFIYNYEKRHIGYCTHSYYVLPFKYNRSEAKGIHRDIFIEAVKAELSYENNRIDRGIPIGCGYIKPLNAFPLFESNNHILKGHVYSINNTPNAFRLWSDELFLTLYHGLPLNEEDMNDIINAFMKVYENIEELR